MQTPVIRKRPINMDEKQLKVNVEKKKRKKTSKDRLLEWNNLYSNTKFGILIQCSKCVKWRKVTEYEEEHEVPDYWCCTMSTSGISGCDDPENQDVDISPVRFVPGSIVWAKVEGYPWWPGMIEDDPDIEEFYWLEDNGKCDYNITFLDDKVSRAWVPERFVCSFLEKPPQNKCRSESRLKSKYFSLIQAAENKAKEAINMSIKERLKNFSFAHRYEGKWGSPLNLDAKEKTEDITKKLIKELEDIESIKSSDSDISVDSLEFKKNELKKGSNIKKSLNNDQIINSGFTNESYKNILESKKCLIIEEKNKPKKDDPQLTAKNKKPTKKSLKKFIDIADNDLNTTAKTTDISVTEATILLPQKKCTKKIKHLKLDKIKHSKEINASTSLEKDKNIITHGNKTKINDKLNKAYTPNRKKVNCEEKRDSADAKESEKESVTNSKETKKFKNMEVIPKIKKEDGNEKVETKTLNKSMKYTFKPPIKDYQNNSQNRKGNEMPNIEKYANNITSDDSGTSTMNQKNSMQQEFCQSALENTHSDTDFKYRQEKQLKKLSFHKKQIQDKGNNSNCDQSNKYNDNKYNVGKISLIKQYNNKQLEIKSTKKTTIKENLKPKKIVKLNKAKCNATKEKMGAIKHTGCIQIYQSTEQEQLPQLLENDLKSSSKIKPVSKSESKFSNDSDITSETLNVKGNNEYKNDRINSNDKNSTNIKTTQNIKIESTVKTKKQSMKKIKQVGSSSEDFSDSTPNTMSLNPSETFRLPAMQDNSLENGGNIKNLKNNNYETATYTVNTKTIKIADLLDDDEGKKNLHTDNEEENCFSLSININTENEDSDPFEME